MNLRQLQYFVKIVDAGNISRAAEALHVAQPSLGVHISHLENEFGVKLLSRHSRGVAPTAIGQVFYERASDILHRVDALRDEIRAHAHGGVRPLVIGLPPSTMNLLGPQLLVDAPSYVPGVSIELVEDRSSVLVQALHGGDGKVDIALCLNLAPGHRLMRVPLFEEELIYVSPPGIIEHDRPVTLVEIFGKPLAIAGGRGIVRDLVKAEAVRLSLPLDLAYRVQSISTLKTVILRERVASIMPFGSMAAELAEGVLEYRRIVGRPLYWTIYLAWAAGNEAAEGPATELLRDYMAAQLRSKLGDLVRPLPASG